jgi:hypothetical protein
MRNPEKSYRNQRKLSSSIEAPHHSKRRGG